MISMGTRLPNTGQQTNIGGNCPAGNIIYLYRENNLQPLWFYLEGMKTEKQSIGRNEVNKYSNNSGG